MAVLSSSGIRTSLVLLSLGQGWCEYTGLKDTDSQTSPAQSVAASRVYDAFGNVVSSSGTWTGPFGYAGNFGYQQDASGLKLLGHRYYDPSTGRFLTRDPIKDGRNWYAYGAGEASPTNITDADGLQPRPPTDDEMWILQGIISMIRLADPKKADELEAMLMAGRILVEDIAKGGYGRMETEGANAGKIIIWASLLRPQSVMLMSVLVHELIHTRQWSQGRARGRLSPRVVRELEGEAREAQLEFLGRLARRVPRLVPEIDKERRRVSDRNREGRVHRELNATEWEYIANADR